MQEASSRDVKPVEMYANADDIPLAVKMTGLNTVMPKNVAQNQLIQMLAQNLSNTTSGEMEVKNKKTGSEFTVDEEMQIPSWLHNAHELPQSGGDKNFIKTRNQ
jgi:hypothetical protein